MAHPSGLTFPEQLRAKLQKAKKAKDAIAVVYYKERLANENLVACGSCEQFKNSWAGEQWLASPACKDAVEAVLAEFKRFSFLP